MERDRHQSASVLTRMLAAVALVAAIGLVVWMVTSAGATRDGAADGNRPPTTKLSDIVADPERYAGERVAVAGRVHRRIDRSYLLKARDERDLLQVRRLRAELRPYARRGDRIEVIGVVRPAPAGAPRRVAAAVIADEVLLHDRAASAPGDR